MSEEQKGNIIIYQSGDGISKIDVRLEDENVWLSQQQMAELYQSSRTNVVEHIQNIYEEAELDKNSTCRNFRQVRLEGNRNVNLEIPFYNLNMIISLGYRIKSNIVTKFRIWTTERLKEYKKYKAKTLSNVERDYLENISTIEKKAKKGSRKR